MHALELTPKSSLLRCIISSAVKDPLALARVTHGLKTSKIKRVIVVFDLESENDARLAGLLGGHNTALGH